MEIIYYIFQYIKLIIDIIYIHLSIYSLLCFVYSMIFSYLSYPTLFFLSRSIFSYLLRSCSTSCMYCPCITPLLLSIFIYFYLKPKRGQKSVVRQPVKLPRVVRILLPCKLLKIVLSYLCSFIYLLL